MTPNKHSVIVIGAGIIGVCCASYLVRDGHRVVLLDPHDPGSQTSFGNAGALATPEVAPFSLPGTLWNVPKWLLDSSGPLVVRWRYIHRLLPWFLRFLWAGRVQTAERITRDAATLLSRVDEDYAPLIANAGLQDMVRREGALSFYLSRAALDAAAYEWQLRRRHGVEWSIVEGAELQQLEPALAGHIRHAIYMPDWRHVDDPFVFTTGLAQQALRDGVQLEKARAVEILHRAAAVHGVRLEDGRQLGGHRVVVAAGAWSLPFVEAFGHKVPLEAERGYHLTLPHAGLGLRKFLLSAGDGFVVLPMGEGIRLAGTAEFARLDAPADERRAWVLLDKAKRFLKPFDTRDASVWMGQRPALPDYLPVIGTTPRCRGLVYAFGHGHLGLTLGATTGRLVADLVAGRPPEVAMRPYRIDRY